MNKSPLDDRRKPVHKRVMAVPATVLKQVELLDDGFDLDFASVE